MTTLLWGITAGSILNAFLLQSDEWLTRAFVVGCTLCIVQSINKLAERHP